MRQTQQQRIIDWLELNGTITPLEAITELGVLALSQRVGELRRDGHKITSEMVDVKNRFGETCRVAQYSLLKTDMEVVT